MGARANSTMRKILGSVSGKVAMEAPCTVTVVRIRDADVRNDLLILQDSLDLKQAGLVPRLDVLRRRAIEASDQETLIQAMADRAIARRQLAVVLNLPADVTPSASDPIVVQPRWPLNLEQSLLAAYRGNPELETLLAAREALARERDATAAALGESPPQKERAPTFRCFCCV